MSCSLERIWNNRIAIKAVDNVLARLDKIKVENDTHGDKNYTKALIAFKKTELERKKSEYEARLEQSLKEVSKARSEAKDDEGNLIYGETTPESLVTPKTTIDDNHLVAWEGHLDSETNSMFAKYQGNQLLSALSFRSPNLIRKNNLFGDIDFAAKEAARIRRRQIQDLMDYDKTEPYDKDDKDGILRDGDLVWVNGTFGIYTEKKDKNGKIRSYFTELRNGIPVRNKKGENKLKAVKKENVEKRKSRTEQLEEQGKKNNENNTEGSGTQNKKAAERAEEDEEQLEKNKNDKTLGKAPTPLAFYADDSREGYMSLVNLFTGRNEFTSAIYKFFNIDHNREDLKDRKVYYTLDEDSIPSELLEKFNSGQLSFEDISSPEIQDILIKNLTINVEIIGKNGKSFTTPLYNWNRYSEESFGKDLERNETPNLIELFSNILVLSSQNKLSTNPKKIFGKIEYSTWGTFTNEIVLSENESGVSVVEEPVLTNITKLIYKGVGKARKQIGNLGNVRNRNIFSKGKYYPIGNESVSEGSAFVLFEDPVEGTIIPVKVSGRNLNKKEAEEIFKIASKLLKSIPDTDSSFTMKQEYENTGLTAYEYLNLLTFITDNVDNEGVLLTERNWSMGFQQRIADEDGNTVTDALFIYGKDENGESLMLTADDLEKPSTKEDFINFVIANKKRHLLIDPIESEVANSLFDVFDSPVIKEFTFLGKKYKRDENLSYLDFVLEQEILQTDIELIGGRVQANRQVVVSNSVQFEEGEDSRKTKTKAAIKKLIDAFKAKIKEIKDKGIKTLESNTHSYYSISKEFYERQTSFLKRILGEEDDTINLNMAWGAAIGNVVDSIGRDVFSGKTEAEILKKIDKFIKDAWKDLPSDYKREIAISKKVREDIVDSFMTLKESLEEDYEIFSEDLTFFLDFKEAFEDKERSGETFKGAAGALDTILINKETGEFHILDFKNIKWNATDNIAGKTKGENFIAKIDDESYGKPKRESWSNQQTFYKFLLEKNGYPNNVSSINILPIVSNYQLNDGKLNLTSLKFVELPKGEQSLNNNILKLEEKSNILNKAKPYFPEEGVPPVEPDEEPTKKGEIDFNAIPGNEENNNDDPMADELAVSEVDESEYGSGNVQKDTEFLIKAFGDMIPIHILKKVFKLTERGADLFAAFYKGAIYLSEEGVLGQGAHEAMHIVEKLFLTAEELTALNRETYRKYYKKGTEATIKTQQKFLAEKIKEIQAKVKASYGIELTEQEALGKHLSELRAEELRALTIDNYEAGLGKKTLNFLKYTLENIFALFRDPSARLVYERIARGYYKEAPIIKKDNTVRYTSFFASEEKEIDESKKALDNLLFSGFEKRDLDNLAHYILFSILHIHEITDSKKPIRSIKDFGLKEGETLIFEEGIFKDFIESAQLKLSKRLEKLKIFKPNEQYSQEDINDRIKTIETQINNLESVKENFKYFYNDSTKKGYLVDFITKLGLKVSFTEEDAKKERNKDIAQATKSHFETSGKDNVRFKIKLMLSFMLSKTEDNKTVRDPKTGWPLLETPTIVFQKMQDLMSGIVEYEDTNGKVVTVKDQIFNRLEIAAKHDLIAREVLKELKEITKGKGTLDPDQTFAEFAVSMQNSRLNFLSSFINLLKNNQREANFFNPAVNSQAYRIRNSWIENLKNLDIFKYDELEDSFTVQEKTKENIKNVIASIEDIISKELERLTTYVNDANFPKENKEYLIQNLELNKEFLENLSILLSEVGIKMTPEAIQYLIDTELKLEYTEKRIAANSTLDRVRAILKGTPINSDTSKTTGGLYNILARENTTYLKSLNDFITGPSFFNYEKNNHIKRNHDALIPFVNAVIATEKENVEQVISGAEGKLKYLYGLNNYMHIRMLEFMSSRAEVEKSLKASWSKGSLFLDQIRKGAQVHIRTFESIKVNNGKDLGTEAKNLDTANDHSTRVNMVLNRKPFVPLPTMAEKPIWSLLEGLDLNKYDLAIRDNEFKFERTLNEDGTYAPLEEAVIEFGDFTIDIFLNYAIKELERVRKVHRQLFGKNKLTDNQLIDTYHYVKEIEGKKDRKSARGLEFIIFPLLNDSEFLKKIGWKDDQGNFLDNADSLKQDKHLRPRIAEVLRKRVIVEIKDAIDKGTIKEDIIDGVPFLSNVLIDKDIIDRKTLGIAKTEADIAYIIADYGIKSTIAFIESTMMYANDPAFYESLKLYTKRHPGIIAPGTSPFMIDPKDTTYNVAVIKDFIYSSTKYYSQYLNAAKKELKSKSVFINATAAKKKELLKALDVAYSPYKFINATDGQGYISFERWRYLMKGLGMWDPNNTGKWDAAFERLNDPNKKPDPEDLALLIAQPIKGQHFENRFEEYLGSEVPTYLKYSQAVLIPAVISGTSLGALSDKMRNEGVNEVVFESAIKVGALSPIRVIDAEGNFTDTVKDEEGNLVKIPFNVFTLKNKYWRLQQQLTPHEESDTMVGSQVQKMVLADFKASDMFDLDGEMYSGRDIRKHSHEIDRILADLERYSMFKEWGIRVNADGKFFINDFNKFSKVIISTLKNKSTTPSKLIESLQPNEQGTDFVVPLDANYSYRDQINSTIASMITDRLIRVKTTGNSLIMMSGFGFTPVKGFKDLTPAEQDKLRNNTFVDRLQPVRLQGEGENQTVLAAQVYLPHRFKKLILDYNKANKGNPKAPTIDITNAKQVRNFIKDRKLFQSVAYRIPTQGLSSAEALEAVGFLDESMGDTIVVYNELTAKTGADFDIDKLFIMLPEFKINKEGKPVYIKWHKAPEGKNEIQYNREIYKNSKEFKKALRNRKIDIYFSILTSPNSFVRLTNPLDSIALKNASAEIQYLEAKKNLTNEEINRAESADFSNYYSIVTKILESKDDLEWFSPSNQLFIKESYQAGQAGVGQKANHSSDHAISTDTIVDYEHLESPLYFEDWMGIGARTRTGKTDLSTTEDSNGNLISSLISARLDGFLDIAKDDYITRLNDNIFTSNLYSLLDRTGVSPEWSNKFMSSPVLKQWVKRTKYINSPVTEFPTVNGVRVYSAEQELRLILTKQFLETDKSLASNESLVKIEGNKTTLRELDLTNQTTRKDFASVLGIPFVENETDIQDIFTIESLVDILDSSKNVEHEALKNIAILDTFLSLKSRASYLNKVVIASKHDTNGAYKGLVGSLHALNLKDTIQNDPLYKILGFNERFEGTSLGKYEEYGPKLMANLLGGYSILVRDSADNIIYDIAQKAGKEFAAKSDEEFFKGIYNALTSYIYSKTPYFKSINIASLLYDKKNSKGEVTNVSVASELWNYQNNEDSPIKNNLLIQTLKVETSLQGKSSDINYISFDATEVREGIDKDDLTRHWQNLFNHEDQQVRAFAKRLFDFSLISSGFYKTVNSFADLAPLQVEIDTNMFEDFKVISSGLFMTDEDISDFLKSNVNNTKLVPEYYQTKLNEEKDATIVFHEKVDGYKHDKLQKGKFIITKADDIISSYFVTPIITVSKHNKRLKIKEAPVDEKSVEGYAIFTPIIEVPGLDKRKNERYTYEFIGYDEDKNALYQISQKFGQHTKNRIFEGVKNKSAIVNNRFNLRLRKKGAVNFINVSNLDLKPQKEAIKEVRKNRLKITIEKAKEENLAITGEEIESNQTYTERPAETGTSVGEDSNNKIDLETSIFADKLSGMGLNRFYIVNPDNTITFYNSLNEVPDENLEEGVKAVVRENLDLQEKLLTFIGEFESSENPAFAKYLNNTKSLLQTNKLYLREISEGKTLPMKPAKVILAESPAIQNIPVLKTIYNLVLQHLGNSTTEVVLVEGLLNKYGKSGLFFTKEEGADMRGILLVDDSLSPEEQAIIVLHEVLHKFTVNGIREDSEFRSKIEAIFNVYQEQVTSPPKSFNNIIEENEDKGIEGMNTILSEFITYGLTNRDISNQLKKINTWGKFIKAIKELFSPLFGKKALNAHDLLVDAVTYFVDANLTIDYLKNDIELTIQDILSIYEGMEDIKNKEEVKDVLDETFLKHKKVC
jgi:hypothetical protein